ncbi:MAG: CBS domain-containing protein [Burkholderiales bacterium]
MQAQDLMTAQVWTIEAEAGVREAAKRMLTRRVSALPVVDGSDRVTGIVSEGDI